MRILSLAFVALFVTALAACSDSGSSTDSIPLKDGQGTLDGSTGIEASVDGPGQLDMGEPALLTTVINKLTLGTSATEYAVDLDNDGTVDNRLGAIMGILKAFYDLQTELDTQMSSGQLLLLFQVFAKSLTDDTATKVRGHQGADKDGNAADNFSGTEEFGIASTSPSTLILSGSIATSKLKAGPGDLMIPFPMGTTTLFVNLKKGQIKADVSSTGMQNGQINGAIPSTDVDNKILPALASGMTSVLNDITTPAATVTFLKMFDTNKDNSITATELKSNYLIGTLIAPDVDTDGDTAKTKDALSVGMAFTATTCTIKN